MTPTPTETRRFESKGPLGVLDVLILEARLIDARARHFCALCSLSIEKGERCWRVIKQNGDLHGRIGDDHVHENELSSFWHWKEFLMAEKTARRTA